MSTFISKETIEELTGKKTYKAQEKALRKLGFVVLRLPGQPPKVTIDNFTKQTGGEDFRKIETEANLHFDLL